MANLRNKYGNNDTEKRNTNIQLLFTCKDYWDNLSSVRREAIYNRQMYHGQQWTKEEVEQIKRQNRQPLKINIISQILTNITGQYLSGKGKPTAIARKQDAATQAKLISLSLEYANEINKDDRQDISQFVNLCLCGLVCSRIDYGYISEKDEDNVISDNINIHTLFFTPVLDEGGIKNIDIIGTINEDTLDGLCVNFAENLDDINFIRERYGYDTVSGKKSKKNKNLVNDFVQDIMLKGVIDERQDDSRIKNLDFFMTDETRKCRYYEVWTKEARQIIRYHDESNGKTGVSEISLDDIQQINNQRVIQCIENGIPPENAKLIHARQRIEYVWRYRFITPDGYILQEGDSPFEHQSHPYILDFYKIADGNILPLVSDLTALQRYINRLIMQMDFQMGYGAKGALFYKDTLLENHTPEEIQEAWTSFNKAVPVHLGAGETIESLVHQFYSQQNIAPAMNIMNAILELAQHMTGVNSAIQGQKPTAGTPASRYAQETANAQLNSRPLLEVYSDYRRNKYNKEAKLIQQYYSDDMFINVAGKDNLEFSPEVRNIDFDLTITQEINEANYSLSADEKVITMVLQGLIPIECWVDTSYSPEAKRIKEWFKQKQEEQMRQQEAMAMQQGQLPPDADGQTPQLSEDQMQQLLSMLQQSGQQTPYEEIPQEDGTVQQPIPQYQNDNQEGLLQQFLNA